ncbi:hypothetical protein [Stenotrophomonas sp. B1-1]|uniref:hypothetical protein n=1 Tax=Stenotrophomonas sp. B1-1 TaxID=2710648 RepID=UPI0013D91568|nr:hypothetical protein [Stenotrophomonas sp. B1-1]
MQIGVACRYAPKHSITTSHSPHNGTIQARHAASHSQPVAAHMPPHTFIRSSAPVASQQPQHLRRRRHVLWLAVIVLTASCQTRGEDDDVETLATEVRIEIGQHTLELPIAALQGYGERGSQFSLGPRDDSRQDNRLRSALQRRSLQSKAPIRFDSAEVAVSSPALSTESLNRAVRCQRLARPWARAACLDGTDATARAVPARFTLVDLQALQPYDGRVVPNCLEGEPRQRLPSEKEGAILLCPARVFGGDVDEFHTAVVRIDDRLGALWTVWRNDSSGESVQDMARRQGQAITLLAKAGLGDMEDSDALRAGMQSLWPPRAPGNR